MHLYYSHISKKYFRSRCGKKINKEERYTGIAMTYKASCINCLEQYLNSLEDTAVWKKEAKQRILELTYKKEFDILLTV